LNLNVETVSSLHILVLKKNIDAQYSAAISLSNFL